METNSGTLFDVTELSPDIIDDFTGKWECFDITANYPVVYQDVTCATIKHMLCAMLNKPAGTDTTELFDWLDETYADLVTDAITFNAKTNLGLQRQILVSGDSTIRWLASNETWGYPGANLYGECFMNARRNLREHIKQNNLNENT